jgi:cell division protein FtsI (penicillin-binding protein 3)
MAGQRRHGRSAHSAADGRIRLLQVVLLLAFIGIVGRAFALTASSSGLSSVAQRNSQRTVILAAHRGDIVDRNGAQIAVGKEQQTVWATPHLLTDPRGAARQLAKLLHVPRAKLEKAFLQKDSWYTCVARQIDPSLAKKALDLKIIGVGSSPEEKRVYPLKTLAAQVVGYVGTENTGLAGLEQKYNPALRGLPGSEVVVIDAAGQVLKTASDKDPQTGATVRLTIDQAIQLRAETILRDTVRQYHAKGATAIVMDPQSGTLLALANVPLVDANKWGQAKPAIERNRAITDIYEPGSTFKVITVSAALEDRLVTPKSSFVLPYQLVVDGHTFQDAEPRGTEKMTVRDILSQSSNVGAATLGRLLGKQELLRWINKFGFGKPTGIAFPGEAAGKLPGYWANSTTVTVPMGQGISVTALQMASAYAAVANGGILQEPRLVAAVGDRPTKPARQRRVISAAVAKQVLSMMNDVVMEGTGTAFQIPGYTAAGKTGTAQVPDYNHGGYAHGKYIASFIGLVPAAHPKLLVMVVVDEPTSAIFGGVVAAPAAQKIAQFVLTYLKIAP